jgi:hypothetical protein
LLIAEGLGWIYTIIAKWNRGFAALGYAALVVLFFLPSVNSAVATLKTPYNESDIKPVMAYLAEKRLSDDIIYVYYIGDSAFHYYAPFYGIDTKNVVTGTNSRLKKVALKSFYEDVKKLSGNKRVWFIFSGLVDCDGCEGDKDLFYVNYLNEHGVMLDSFQATDASAYLYNLNP